MIGESKEDQIKCTSKHSTLAANNGYNIVNFKFILKGTTRHKSTHLNFKENSQRIVTKQQT
uniref:Uncharacterized protein n=1 Tax=Solanum lycopersicum TaxID=4081 RepID=A0A3Q7GGM9_SOLLC